MLMCITGERFYIVKGRRLHIHIQREEIKILLPLTQLRIDWNETREDVIISVLTTEH